MVNKNAELPPLDYLLAFEAAAEFGSFAKASEILNISESSVSRKIKLLEHHFNRAFFIRGHRSITLTHNGYLFHKDISPLLEELRKISNHLYKENLIRTVTLAMTNAVAALWLVPRLMKFNALNKNVRIKVIASDSDEECLSDDISLSILRGNGKWPGYEAHLLFDESIFPVCAPTYLEKNPEIRDLNKITKYSLIGEESEHIDWMNWSQWLSIVQKKKVYVDQTVLVNTHAMSIEAAASGIGIALGRAHLIDHLIKEQKLVLPLKSKVVKTNYGYYLLKPSKHPSCKERDLIEDWVLSVS